MALRDSPILELSLSSVHYYIISKRYIQNRLQMGRTNYAISLVIFVAVSHIRRLTTTFATMYQFADFSRRRKISGSPLVFYTSRSEIEIQEATGVVHDCCRCTIYQPKRSNGFVFHIVVSVVSVVRKKFIGQIQLYGNLPYKCSIQKKR